MKNLFPFIAYVVVPANRPKQTHTAMIGENLKPEKPLLTKTSLE